MYLLDVISHFYLSVMLPRFQAATQLYLEQDGLEATVGSTQPAD